MSRRRTPRLASLLAASVTGSPPSPLSVVQVGRFVRSSRPLVFGCDERLSHRPLLAPLV